jgi:hypothetical protein
MEVKLRGRPCGEASNDSSWSQSGAKMQVRQASIRTLWCMVGSIQSRCCHLGAGLAAD